MHEVSIALAIVEEVCERFPSCHAELVEARVQAVHLRIGALTGVVPDALRFAWDLATEGTPAAGSQLVIEHVPLAIACTPCGAEREITGSLLPVCPQCGTSSTAIVRGRELLITAMEVQHAASAPGRAAEHSAQEQYARN